MKFSYVLPDPKTYSSLDAFAGDIACMKELGYDAVELQIEDPKYTDEAAICKCLNNVGFDLIAIQTGTSYYTHGNCLCTPNAAIRQRTVELLERFIDFAERFSSILVFGSLQGRSSDEPNYQQGLNRIVQAIEKIGTYATSRNVVLAYEPVNHLETAFCNTIGELEQIVRNLNLPGVQMMIDTFHMNIEERSMADCFIGIADLIKHVHLSETNRDILGQGHWNCRSFFEQLTTIGYKGYCSLGVYNTRLETRECMQACMDVVKPFR